MCISLEILLEIRLEILLEIRLERRYVEPRDTPREKICA
jgi:hypothetical protein